MTPTKGIGSDEHELRFARVNFEIDRDLMRKLKMYVAEHDTTIKDLLTAHIHQLVSQETTK